MAEIINLKQARKTKARAAAEQDADANRRKFGRTKSEKVRDASEKQQAVKLLDSSRLDPNKK